MRGGRPVSLTTDMRLCWLSADIRPCCSVSGGGGMSSARERLVRYTLHTLIRSRRDRDNTCSFFFTCLQEAESAWRKEKFR